MGFSISWLTVKGKMTQEILDGLGLKANGRRGDFFDFIYAGQELANGDYLLVADRCDHPFQSAESLANLSARGEALACSLEEHVMYTMATLWKNGEEIWRIEHKGERALEDLKVKGIPPEIFNVIREDYAARQASDREVDWYSEMPLALARQLSGFKHDEANDVMDGKFDELVSTREQFRKIWWKFW